MTMLSVGSKAPHYPKYDALASLTPTNAIIPFTGLGYVQHAAGEKALRVHVA